MTHSGYIYIMLHKNENIWVLIPLLLDDPLWAVFYVLKYYLCSSVLIPLLLDDPLWVNELIETQEYLSVLIPLLLDDPLWAEINSDNITKIKGLNPSFAG